MASDGERVYQKRRSKQNTSSNDTFSTSPTTTRPTPYADVSTDDDLYDGPPRTSSSTVRRQVTSTQPSRITNSQSMRRANSTKEYPLQSSSQQTRQTQIARQTQTQPTRNVRMPDVPPSTTRGVEKQQPRTINISTNAIPPAPAPRRNAHWLLPAGIGMIVMLVLWVLASSVLSWATDRYNDYRYGLPRTYHVDQAVGHNNDSRTKPSHFMAMNYNHQAIVVELMAGDPTKSVTYVSPVNIAGDEGLSPVTVEFQDVNNDKLLDMIMHIHLKRDNQVSFFINDGKKFRPANSSDKIKLP